MPSQLRAGVPPLRPQHRVGVAPPNKKSAIKWYACGGYDSQSKWKWTWRIIDLATYLIETWIDPIFLKIDSCYLITYLSCAELTYNSKFDVLKSCPANYVSSLWIQRSVQPASQPSPAAATAQIFFIISFPPFFWMTQAGTIAMYAGEPVLNFFPETQTSKQAAATIS